MSQIKVAIVGCGKIADAHVDQARATGLAEVVAVCDTEPLMAKQISERMSVSQAFSDIKEMIRVATPDVVHLATPPDSHVALAKICFDAGVHVVVEKPFANTSAQAQEIFQAAKAANKLVTVNHMYCFEDPYLAFKNRFDKGELGDLIHCQATFGYDLAGDYGVAVLTDENHWVHRLPGKLFHNVLDHIFCKWSPFLESDDFEVQANAFRMRKPVNRPVIDALPDELRFMIRAGNQTFGGHISAHARPVPHTMQVYATKDSMNLDFGCRTATSLNRQKFPGSIGRVVPAAFQAGEFFKQFLHNAKAFKNYEYHYFQGMRRLLSQFYQSTQGHAQAPLAEKEVMRTCRLIDSLVIAIDQSMQSKNGASA
jgi:predicted dehydrogenase